ncbi:K02A2.6-like [Cordylochernes scorpioides]|uniref:RNA-directed DNA polymerase n=1 Tax=Cordylochernes scorpioides TaxID=51811 RepID=A0ABY6JXA9_9ARAC|nr:K02A2.6-like [Cordylochernes scorpioides]
MASSTGNSLQPFVPGTNPSEAWGKWKKRFQMFYIATEIDKKSIPRQRAILLYNIGELALDIYSTFKIQETDASPTVPDILELFDGHFKPYKNTTYKRYQFFTTEQGENQNFDDYVTELKNKSMDCEFGELADSLVRDRIIIGIKDKALKERMLQDPDLSLAKAIDLGRATETSRQQVKNITREDVDLHSIKYKKQYKKNFKYPVGRKPNVSEEHPNAKVCQNCGSRHPYGKCFAYGKICNSCKKPNHFAKMCRNRVHMLEGRAEEEEEMCLQYLSLDSITGLEWTKIILVENNSVNFKLDTGAQVNILPLDTIKNWQNKPCIYPTGIAVYSYTGEKFEFNKMQLAQEKVKFIGHEISKNGISADPSKLEAIQKIKRPMDKTSLQRFLGTVNYLAKFMHNLADKTVLLRQLLKKNTLWTWNEAIEKEFIELKNLVSNPPVLGLFDPHRKVTLSVDASQHGLGAVLMQEGRPIAFASASLNNTQKKYAQIEKELLALWYGCQRFNYHLYGRKFTAQTDHKPLLAILKKPLEELSPRLERLVLKLMRYDFNLEYVPGKVIHTADTLSRDSISEETIDTSDLDLQNTIMTLNLKVTTKRYQEILRDMESDEEMIKLRDHILNGWPIHKKSVDYAVKPYWHCKEELYIWKDLICRGQRLVIPKVQRESILQTLHMSHQGISACKNRAHEAIYWPGLDREIEEMVYKCRICQESQPSQRKEPLIPHEIADYPWQKVAIDFFYLDQSVFIIIVDYYSSFPEVIKVASTSAKEILPVLKSTFARHGIPEIIITDNGPPFTSQDFTNFTNEWDIEHKTSSPGYPKSNGLVERMVQTVKKQLKKCRQDNTDPYMCLIALRTTPSNNLPSPAQMLMGRNLRTLIPMKTTKLKPAFISTENILQQKRENQYKMKEYYDRNAKILPKMSSGEQVNAKTSDAWRPATIIGEANQPRSYIIQNNEGRMLKRNRVHLRPRSYPVGQRRSSQSSPQLDPAPSTSSESSGQREPGEFPRLNLSPEELAPSTSTPIGNYNEGGTAYTTRSGRVVKPPKRFDPGL